MLLSCVFLNYLSFMNVAAFLPIFVEANYKEITSLQVGALMSCYPITQLLISPFAGTQIAKIGRKHGFVYGICLNAIATLLFGLASYF